MDHPLPTLGPEAEVAATGTHQAWQDGCQPHVPAIAGVVHLVNELIRGPHVSTYALQRIYAVWEGGDICKGG